MTQNTNLNVSPYYDDFDENKNYSKVLFKPGFPVQSRELTTLQSILQNQIEKFGQHFFKEGSVVIPGGIFYDNRYFCIRIDPNFLGVPVSQYTQKLVDGNIEIEGEISGVRATVVNKLTQSESEDGFDTLYIKYNSSGKDGENKTFIDGENLITLSTINYSTTSIAANSQFARTIVSESNKIGSSASLSEGVFFVRGYFIKAQASTVILDQYENSPTYRVGLQINEDIVNASSLNPDLFDNAQGYSNQSAPGADRFKISVNLTRKSVKNTDDINFIELLRVENGEVVKMVENIDYNIFKDELARRTYDESGDYYIRPFNVDIRESLNDRLGNNGVYSESQTTQNGNTPSESLFTLQISPGKAYVRGYEINKVSTSSIDVEKPRTVQNKDNISSPVRIGNEIKIENLYGSPSLSQSSNLVEFTNQRLEGSQVKKGDVIGKARVYDFERAESGVGTSRFDLRLFDIEMITSMVVGIGITASNSAFVKGKFSGASGHLTSAISGSTSLSLTEVEGEFQINEPLTINGIEVGSNIISIVNNDISSVKSVRNVGATTSFAANISLINERNIGGDMIMLGGATSAVVTNPRITDFRGIVKVNDIFKFNKNGADDIPTFNRVTSVGAGGTNFILGPVDSVAGVCDGTILTSGSRTRSYFPIISGKLEKSEETGKRIKLKNENVASINLVDSSYIVKKQITKTVTGSTFTFPISDLGDNDLFFEPFTKTNYTLTWGNGDVEVIEFPQVTISDNLKEIEITGLSKTNVSATLTATCKRSTIKSKTKTIKRCEQLIVNKSKFSGAGIGSTTFDNGLTFNDTFGYRVEDEVIALGFAEGSRILGIFESNDNTDPDIPSVTVSSQSDSFTGNVITGEQFIGAESGAVARVVTVSSSAKLDFVYENDRRFTVDESFTLKTSGIVATIDFVETGDKNITDSFSFDDGHREEFVDIARIIRNPTASEPTRRLKVIYDYFETDENSGTVESINSYNSLNYGTDIPFVLDSRASDYIDLRPRVNPVDFNSAISPFSIESRSFTNSSSETAATNRTFVLDYAFYLGRIDRLYLTKDGVFEIKKGKPSKYPKSPTPNNEAFEVGVLSMQPYVFNSTFDSEIKLIKHKRFTMRDIGGLENRIKNLEEFTTLTLLETDTKNLSIKDPNTGLDKFKSGFFVDNFRNHKSHNLKGESNFDIDPRKGECRPRSTERNVRLNFETKSTKADPVNADYRWAADFEDSNITRNGSGLTLDFTEVTLVDQPLATRTENLNPFHIALYAGSIELNPDTDHWIEEVILPTPDIVKVDSVFDGMAELLGVEDRENGGMSAGYWNSVETSWTGREAIQEEVINEEVIGRERISSGRERQRGRGVRVITTDRVTIEQEVLQTFQDTGIEQTFGFELTAGEENISLGDRVVSVDIIHNCRQRNIEVVGKRLKPNTRYYVFMENVDMTSFCTPKFLGISMNRGSFSVGDIVDTVVDSSAGPNEPVIKIRLAKSNHKIGPFNNPQETQSGVASQYTASSTILNVDTAGLASQTRPDHLGYVKKGMVLVNLTGTAEATVEDFKLVSDEKGDLIFTLHIPDPTVASNPKFTTGLNTIRITTSKVNSAILDPGESSAEATYTASGYTQSVEEQVLSIKTPQVERKQIGTDQPVTRITQDITTRETTGTETNVGGWYDPLAQSFLVESQDADGVFVTGGDLFFKTKDTKVPVTVQIRTMRDGSPTTTIVPFGQMNIDPSDVLTSDDGSVATNFKFPTPVYLQSGYEYALTLVAPTEKYLAFITRMGEEDLLLKSIYNRQPYLGSLFKSQNQTTWTPSQLEDLKFKLNKAKFVTNKASAVSFFNTELPLTRIRKNNPITAYSKRQFISIASTTTTFESGNEIIQGATVGKISSFAGEVLSGTTSLEFDANTGIGITQGTYSNIEFSSLTGFGNSCKATVVVNANNKIASINVTDGGEGYQRGDLLIANKVGPGGSGVRVNVGITTDINKLIVDQVSGTFGSSNVYTYFNSSGVGVTMPNIVSVVTDQIRDGSTMLIDHKNHGMHSSTNKVILENFISDVKPTRLTAAIQDNTSIISVVDGSNFTTFEGSPVSNSNPGYLLIDKEIISYKVISGNSITIDQRVVDFSQKSNHKNKAEVFKYEFNGVSLRKINKKHDIDPREKTFDSYYIKLSDTTKLFNKTKTGGGKKVRVSQNIPYEYIRPSATVVTPSGTAINTRVKTVTGTSISGSEGSFNILGFEDVSLNKLNTLSSPRIIASQVNETDILNNEKSLATEFILFSSKEDVSPLIDLDSVNVVLTSNLVDDKVVDFETDSRVRVSGEDPNSALYVTKKIKLAFSSNSLQVIFDGHREAEADIRVFYKLYRKDRKDSSQTYIPFNKDGSPDNVVNPNEKLNRFSEYKFTAENTAQFTAFSIKVVMTSTDQSKPPRFKNFRAIALNSFTNE